MSDHNEKSIFNEEYYYKEFDQFVCIGDDIYCDSDCSICPYKNKCKNEDAEVYIDMVIPARSLVCTSKDRSPYTNEPDKDTQFNDESGRYNGTILPDSDKRVYKIIESIDGIDLNKDRISHIVFNKEDYYCIKQLCSNCSLKDKCKRRLEIKESHQNVIVAVDARAQEPRSFLLTTKQTNNYEKEWDRVFYNDTIRALSKEYQALETTFKNLGIDVESDIFKLWVDRSFFYDKTDMYKLSDLINRYTIDQECKTDLKNHINKLYTSFKEMEKEHI